jgi:hypothetical protein
MTAAKHAEETTIAPLPLYDNAPILAAVSAVAEQLTIMNAHLAELVKAVKGMEE